MKRTFGKLLLALLIAAVPAVSGWPLGINPTRFVFHAKHGETLEGTFLIVNDKDEEVPVTVEIAKGIDSGENKNVIKDANWLTLTPTAFVLDPKGKKEIAFKADVPDGTAGTFSARISFVDRSNEAYSSAITVPVYVIIKGTEKVKWDITKLSIDSTPAGLLGGVEISNKGNVHFYANGMLFIQDSKGVECFRSTVGGFRAVFPKTTTPLPFDVSKMNLQDGKYKVRVNMNGYEDKNREFRFTLIKKSDQYDIRRN
jgi:hypothetical protein